MNVLERRAGTGTGTERTRPWVWQMPSSIIPVWSPQCLQQAYTQEQQMEERTQCCARLFSLLSLFKHVFLNMIKSQPPAQFFCCSKTVIGLLSWFGEIVLCVFLFSPFHFMLFWFLPFLLFLGGVPETLSQRRLKKNKPETVPLRPAQDSCKFKPKIPERVWPFVQRVSTREPQNCHVFNSRMSFSNSTLKKNCHFCWFIDL